MARIVIVGGGISGLAAAFRIREKLPNATLTILESSSQAGGLIGTTVRDGFRVERGPNGIFDANPKGIQLCNDLGLSNELITGSEESRKNRYLFVHNQLQKLPGSPLGILTTRTLSLRGRLSLLCEPFRRKRKSNENESIAQFARRRFGQEAADVFVDGLVTGIYAGDPKRLSLNACFPRLAKYESESGSVIRGVLHTRKRKQNEARLKGETSPGPQRLWSFRGGLNVLIQTLAQRLGDSLIYGVKVDRIKRQENEWQIDCEGNQRFDADVVVLACPADQQAQILSDIEPQIAAILASITYNRIAVVALGYRREQVTGPQNGFGYIAPQNLGRDVLGVQWCSSVFPDRAPPGSVLWRALCGGVQRSEIVDWPDEELLRRVHHEMQATIGVTGEPIFSEIIRWPRAIPQYEVGHLEKVARINAHLAKLPGLFLGGNSLRGVAVADCAEQGERISKLVHNYLANPLPTR